MSTPFLELFSQDEIAIILEALESYKTRCKTNGTRSMLGYGKASELEKREKWIDKASEVQDVINKVSTEAS